MSDEQNPVVASLADRSQHPYSSIAISPDRMHAVAAGKDTIRVLSVGPQGLTEISSLRISQVSRLGSVVSDPICLDIGDGIAHTLEN
jgi:hypothetical protein